MPNKIRLMHKVFQGLHLNFRNGDECQKFG